MNDTFHLSCPQVGCKLCHPFLTPCSSKQEGSNDAGEGINNMGEFFEDGIEVYLQGMTCELNQGRVPHFAGIH